jgi:hypothetical protein
LSNLRHGSYRTRPAYALVYAIFAISAPYHVDYKIRARASHWYSKARKFMEGGSEDTLNGFGRESERRLMTVEMVQAGCLLTLVETGNGDHQVRHIMWVIGGTARAHGRLRAARFPYDWNGREDGDHAGPLQVCLLAHFWQKDGPLNPG